MHSLSLHHLGFRELDTAGLVKVAAAVGCDHVCTFVYNPPGIDLPAVSDADVEPLRKLLDDTGVRILGTSSYPMTETVDIAAYEEGFVRAARLGGRLATTRFVDLEESRITENFGRFAELAARYGITPTIEPMNWGYTDAFPQAVRVIKAVGAGTLTLDPLHILRTGTSMDYIESIEPALVRHIQLCDGPAHAPEEVYWHEGLEDRLPLGEGEYPLKRLLDMHSGEFPIVLEIPCEKLKKQGLAGVELAQRIVGRSRAWLDAHGG